MFPKQLEYIGHKTLQGIKCAVFTNENAPEVGSGSVEYTINQISVPMKSLDTYTTLFASKKAISISSYVGYEVTPAEISLTNSPITSCKATVTTYSLQNGDYVAKKENCSVYGLTPESSIEHTWTLGSGNRVNYKGTATGALTFETLLSQSHGYSSLLLRRYVLIASGLSSFTSSGVNPARSSPRDKPPHPANRSKNLRLKSRRVRNPIMIRLAR